VFATLKTLLTVLFEKQ